MMSGLLYIRSCQVCFTSGVGVTVEEKRAWIMAVVSLIAYAVYVVIILSRTGDTRLADVPYVATLLWTIGGAVVAQIVLHTLTMIGTPRGEMLKDQRDKEIAAV